MPPRATLATLWLLLLALLGAPATARADEPPPVVIVSIKPVQSLVALVMAGIAKPDLIVQGNAPAQTYAPKPSDLERLGKARLIFWVGPSLEVGLAKPLAAIAGKIEVVRLVDAPGMVVRPLRREGGWAHDEDAPLDAPDAPTEDGHIWLDPQNARAMVALVASRLAATDPGRAGHYTRNAALLYRRLETLDAELRQKLSSLAGKRYLVYHDAYQYLERRYELPAQGSVVPVPGQEPSQRRLDALRRNFRFTGVRCVFGEPDTPADLVDKLVEGTGVHAGSLDPEGLAMKPGPQLYFDVMSGLATQLRACLLAPG